MAAKIASRALLTSCGGTLSRMCPTLFETARSSVEGSLVVGAKEAVFAAGRVYDAPSPAGRRRLGIIGARGVSSLGISLGWGLGERLVVAGSGRGWSIANGLKPSEVGGGRENTKSSCLALPWRSSERG